MLNREFLPLRPGAFFSDELGARHGGALRDGAAAGDCVG